MEGPTGSEIVASKKMLGVLFVELQLAVYVPCAKVTTLRLVLSGSFLDSEWLREQAIRMGYSCE